MKRRGKEFIFPENVNKNYGVWKDYTVADIGWIILAVIVAVIIVVLPPTGIAFILFKICLGVIGVTIVMAVLTIRPVTSRKNIKVRDLYRIRKKYYQSQKRYYLAPKKRDERREIIIQKFNKDQSKN
ncbi:MAG: conjugal transfer protein [Liquorilactobacillus hordei]|uniref:Conjugal transfer protein n=1 Tax=Liquorilactobacillus hordei TaxID=468911 RepID=A0A3S6QSA7_9LACO|nr:MULTISPECIES: conjugal transfer protein [Liquorilactobacillus]AUJ31011.1 conjugal transfer protein [Liquorilactobacillus hordei]MCC7667548.1 conjugal transfer protein [Liquorilactobacillus satsumensis]